MSSNGGRARWNWDGCHGEGCREDGSTGGSCLSGDHFRGTR